MLVLFLLWWRVSVWLRRVVLRLRRVACSDGKRRTEDEVESLRAWVARQPHKDGHAVFLLDDEVLGGTARSFPDHSLLLPRDEGAGAILQVEEL